MSTVMTNKHPYLFAYDICSPARARPVLKILQRWRFDGQYSVHETWLTHAQAMRLTSELVPLVNTKEDALFLAKLNNRGTGPIWRLHNQEAMYSPLLGQDVPPVPRRLGDASYLLAYDVRDESRLKRVHKATQKKCIALQRSVFLYSGKGAKLQRLMSTLSDEIDRSEDDLRLYAISSLQSLWFLTSKHPPISGAQVSKAARQGLMTKIKLWLKGKSI